MDGLLAAASKAAREAGVGGAPPPGAFGDTGVPPEVMNRQAQQIWSMLDDMASNDPTGYNKFIAKQKEDADLADEPHIFPKPGFTAKTTYSPPREQPLRVFINICHHVAVGAPLLPSGKCVLDSKGATVAEVPENLATAGLTTPLIVGEIRELKKEGRQGATEWVVDVIFHPWVLLHTSQDNFFKTSVTELAFACIEEELGMAVKKTKYKFQKGYKGKMPSGRAAAYLLATEKKRKARRDKGIKPKPPTSKHAQQTAQQAEAKRKAKAKAVMEKMKAEGFNPATASVGAPAGGAAAGVGVSAGGSAKGVKPVDLSTPASLLKSMHEAAGGAGITEVKSSKKVTKKQAATNKGAKQGTSAAKKQAVQERKRSDNESAPSAAPSAPAQVAAPVPKSKPVSLVEEVLPTPKTTVKDGVTKSGKPALVVAVFLPGVESIQGVDLDVSMQKVALVVPEQYQLDLQLPCAVVHGESRAKFSARKSKLTLTIPKSVTA